MIRPNDPAIVQPPDFLRDRDVFHDTEGRVYVTIGFIQPPTRTLSYLKYVPHESGKWNYEGKNYRRIFSGSVASVVEGNQLVPEHYIVTDEYFGTDLLEVPHEDISTYFSPELRLGEILKEGPKDHVEERASLILSTIHEALGIPYSNLGIAGSVVWKAHDPRWSDVNVNVYGFDESWLLFDNYENVASHNTNIHLRCGSDWLRTWSGLKSRIPSLTEGMLKQLFTRRVEFKCMDQFVTVMPVLLPDESPIKYGTERYTIALNRPCEIELRIDTLDYGIFHPAIYETHSHPIPELHGERVSRLMIYDGAFRAMLQVGDKVRVSGTLQQVQSDEEISYQIMVGTKSGAGREYIYLKD